MNQRFVLSGFLILQSMNTITMCNKIKKTSDNILVVTEIL